MRFFVTHTGNTNQYVVEDSEGTVIATYTFQSDAYYLCAKLNEEAVCGS
jgi:hypothetical protein